MALIRQFSFASGELAPTLWGRVDLPSHATGLKRCRNFFLTRQGAAMTRPGTQSVGTAKYGYMRCRLIPFIYPDDVAYVLEFGNSYMRVIRDGAYIPQEVLGDYDALTAYAVFDTVTDPVTQDLYEALGPSTGVPLSNTFWWKPVSVPRPYEVF